MNRLFAFIVFNIFSIGMGILIRIPVPEQNA